MTLDELEASIWAIAGNQLTPKQIKLIRDTAHCYATGDTPHLQAERRRVLDETAAIATGTSYGRRRNTA